MRKLKFDEAEMEKAGFAVVVEQNHTVKMELKYYELKSVALPIGSEAEHEPIDTVCRIVQDFVRDRRWENRDLGCKTN